MRLLLRTIIIFALAHIADVTQAAAAPLDQRAAELAQILADKAAIAPFFAPSFLAEIPTTQIAAIGADLRRANGAVIGVERITADNPRSAVIEIGYERATVTFQLVLEDAAPFRTIGLLVVSSRTRGDTPERLAAEFAALPGEAALLVTRLDDRTTAPIIAHRVESQMAIGSVFKLWVLAEAARQVRSGEARWSDVTPRGPSSLPSGMIQDWPAAAPMTLHTLATLMISISDNSATDTLMNALGRAKVDAMVDRAGHSASAKTLPLLSTIEAFALKMTNNADLRKAWIGGTRDKRRAILNNQRNRLNLGAIDTRQFASGPLFIDTIEWFASAQDLARLLDWLRLNAGDDALAILKVAPGAARGDVDRFTYIGFKGGSEAGVIAAHYLIQTKSGRWYAVNGSWNNRAALVDEGKFANLMRRALALVEP
jgi:beta-lactamase class A